MKKDIGSAVAAIIGVIVIVAVLLMVPTYFLWNWLMPQIFGLPTITLWQALGITILSGILFNKSSSSK